MSEATLEQPSVALPQQEGLRAKDAAAFLGVSEAKFYSLDTAGLIPEGISLGDGRLRVWPATELRSWLLAGAPARRAWVGMRAQVLRRASV